MSDSSARLLLNEMEFRKCAADPIYFFEHYWFIAHPERGAMLFELFEAQKSALPIFLEERLVVTLKSRQIGWTTLVAALALWHVFFHPDRLIIFLSKGEREAQTILKQVKYGEKRLPAWMRERGPKRGAWNMTVCEFDNGSSIESLPSKEDPARGRSCYAIFVDEWAFLDNPADAWASIEPVADVGGRIFGLSTANGDGNFFSDLYWAAVAGTNGFKDLFEPWSARGDRDDDWYQTKVRTLPPWQLHQEYPSSPEEAFIKSGDPFFDVDKLAAIVPVEPRVGSLLSGDYVIFYEQPDGKLSVWKEPHHDDTYVIGADVAEGLAHGDFSSAHVIHWRTHDVVAHWHGHCAADEFGEILADLGRYYNTALVGVEVNNHGLTTCKYLKDWHSYPNIFYARTVDDRTRKITTKIGWTTSKKTRPLMLDGLAAELRDDSLQLVDKATIAELRRFRRDEFGRLRGSPFDDRTMSLSVAVQMLQYVTQEAIAQGRMEWGTLSYWDSVANETSEPFRIGSHSRRS